MLEPALEEIIHEEDFSHLLRSRGERYLQLCNALLLRGEWTRKDIYSLITEADGLESFLDDHGAHYNRTYSYFRELVASVRWFALTGYSLIHFVGRLDTYKVEATLGPVEMRKAREAIESARAFVRKSTEHLLGGAWEEARSLRFEPGKEAYDEQEFGDGVGRLRLPRNVGQEDPGNEEQKIAEVGSKFLAAAEMLANIDVRRIDDPRARREFLERVCSEEQARVYEATVHNLQSAYDTYIKNTVIEARDERLPLLRGHTSAALHLLEAVTYLTHFVERHESGLRNEDSERRIANLVDRFEVQEVTLNHLLFWANRFMQSGRSLAEDLLPSYTNVRELVVELDEDLQLHARPAALIVGIVGHYGTPVSLEIGRETCNAGSILDLIVTVGSHPEARRFLFRGDEKPLRDIGMLFQYGLGEHGIDRLPDDLDYLRNK